MNGHVHEDTAGNLDIAHRLVIGIAGGNLDEIGLAQFVGSDRIADGLVVVVKAANEADPQFNALPFYRSEGFSIFCQLMRRSASQKMCFAGLRSAHDEVCMRCGGGEQMNTASMVGSPKIISGIIVALSIPMSAAHARVASFMNGSATA